MTDHTPTTLIDQLNATVGRWKPYLDPRTGETTYTLQPSSPALETEFAYLLAGFLPILTTELNLLYALRWDEELGEWVEVSDTVLSQLKPFANTRVEASTAHGASFIASTPISLPAVVRDWVGEKWVEYAATREF